MGKSVEPAWWADVRALNGQGMSDADIAEKLGRTKNTVRRVRTHNLGLPALPPAGNTIMFERFDSRPNCNRVVTAWRRRPAWYEELARWNRLGLNDGEIARKLGRPAATVRQARKVYLGLPANATQGGQFADDILG